MQQNPVPPVPKTHATPHQPTSRPATGRPRAIASPVDDDFASDPPVQKSTGWGTWVILAVLVVAAVIGWRSLGPKSALAGWTSDWDAAAEQSRVTGKPPLVLFTADWCPPCKTLKAELNRADVRSFLKDNYTLVVVDLTDRGGPNNARARDYGVRGIPTLILYDANGREQARTFGMDGDALMRWLQSGGRF